MFSRFMQMILSTFTGRFEEIISTAIFAVAREMVQKGRQTLLLIVSSFVFSILLSAGVIISVLEASAQYDVRGTIYLNALLSSSLLMAGISLLMLAIIFWPRRPKTADVPALSNQTASSHPFLAAVVAESMEYLKQRQQAKAHRAVEYSRA